MDSIAKGWASATDLGCCGGAARSRPMKNPTSLYGLKERVRSSWNGTSVRMRQRLIVKASDSERGAARQEDVDNVVAEVWSAGVSGWVLQGLRERPLTSDHIVAFKALVVMHRVLQQGYPQVASEWGLPNVVLDGLVACWGASNRMVQQQHCYHAVVEYARLLMAKMELMIERDIGHGRFDGGMNFDRVLVEPSDMLQALAVLLNFAERLMPLALHLVFTPSKDWGRLERSDYVRLYLGAIMALLREAWWLLCAVSLFVKNLLCQLHTAKQLDNKASPSCTAAPGVATGVAVAEPPWLQLSRHLLAAQPRFVWFHTSMCDFVAHCHQLRCVGFTDLGPHIPMVPQNLLNIFADIGELVRCAHQPQGPTEKERAVSSADSISSLSTAVGSTPRPTSTESTGRAGSSETGSTTTQHQAPSCPTISSIWEPSPCVLDALRTVEDLQRSPLLAGSHHNSNGNAPEDALSATSGSSSVPAPTPTTTSAGTIPAVLAGASAKSPLNHGRGASTPSGARQRSSDQEGDTKSVRPSATTSRARQRRQHGGHQRLAQWFDPKARVDPKAKGYMLLEEEHEALSANASGADADPWATADESNSSKEERAPLVSTAVHWADWSRFSYETPSATDTAPKSLREITGPFLAEWPPMMSDKTADSSPVRRSEMSDWPVKVQSQAVDIGQANASEWPERSTKAPDPEPCGAPAPWATAICQGNAGRASSVCSTAQQPFRAPLWQEVEVSRVATPSGSSGPSFPPRDRRPRPIDGGAAARASPSGRRTTSPESGIGEGDGSPAVGAVASLGVSPKTGDPAPTVAASVVGGEEAAAAGTGASEEPVLPRNPFDLSTLQLQRVNVRCGAVAAGGAPGTPAAISRDDQSSPPAPLCVTLARPAAARQMELPGVRARQDSPFHQLHVHAAGAASTAAAAAGGGSGEGAEGELASPTGVSPSGDTAGPALPTARSSPPSARSRCRPMGEGARSSTPTLHAGCAGGAASPRSHRNRYVGGGAGGRLPREARQPTPPPVRAPTQLAPLAGGIAGACTGGIAAAAAPAAMPAGQDSHPSSSAVGSDWEVDPSELRLEELVGSGSTAEVYRASWHGTDVAVKKLRHAGPLSVEFTRELSVLLRLRHPNLVLFMGASIQAQPMIVSEFCAGGTIFMMLHQRPTLALTWPQRLKVAVDVAKGMNFLHRRQIVHRDLKSLNLLLASPLANSSSVPCVKISDFGLSRVCKADQLSKPQACMTSGAGTYHWMAPEVLNGNAYGEKVDVYSYGVVLFELLAQQIPYEGSGLEPVSIAVAVAKGRRPDVSRVPRDCPADLRFTMECCWAHCPTGRPSFDTILETLKLVNCS